MRGYQKCRLLVYQIVAVVVSWLLALPIAWAAPVTFWENGFEPGDPSGVVQGDGISVINSTLAYAGPNYLNFVGPSSENGSIISWQASSAGYWDVLWFGYANIHDALETGDSVSLLWSPNAGASWLTLRSYTEQPAGDWFAFALNLPVEANDNPGLWFAVAANLGNSSDRILFDEMVARGTPVPEPPALTILATACLAIFRSRRRHPQMR